MLTPTSTALGIPGFIAAPPTAPAVLAEAMKLSRRRCAPMSSLSPRSLAPSQGSALSPAHGDVAASRHTHPPTALHAIGRDFLPPARYSPLHSASPAGWSGVVDSSNSNDGSCFASSLPSGHHTTGPASSGSAVGRRRRNSSTRLGGLRKPRNADGSRSSEGESPDEEDGGDGDEVRSSWRSQRSYESSIPASKRQPPEEEDIWSKHSVFEFKSLNDPDTNACAYKGLSGQPHGPSWDQRRASHQEPAAAPERRLPSAQQAGGIFDDSVVDLLEAQRPTSAFGSSGTTAWIDEDLFRFREKGAIAGTERRREVETRRRGPAGGRRGNGGDGGVGDERSAVKVELATQLGVPATSTYEELRTAYRVEIKRCHPDLAGDNEFRVKFLERKFQKLQGSWDRFNAEHAAGGPPTAAEAEAAARARARARAQEAARERERVEAAAAAAAAARRSRRPVMDEGRTVLDSGNTSSC